MTAPLLTFKHEDGSFRDSTLVDIRPTAEIVRGLLLLNQHDVHDSLHWLLQQQNSNGSWGEVMTHTTVKENTLATAIIAESLLVAYEILQDKRHLHAAQKSFDYILSREIAPGYFSKLENQQEDILNVDAACAFFFHRLWSFTKNKRALAAKQRSLTHVMNAQLPNGAFPYDASSSAVDPYYHALTQFYLYQSSPPQQFQTKLAKGTQWLAQQFDGHRLKWSSGEVLFSLGLVSTYSYSASCFHYAGTATSFQAALLRLSALQQSNGFFPSFEHISLAEQFKGIFRELNRSKSFSLRFSRAFQRTKKSFHPSSAHTPLFYHAQIFNSLTTLLRGTS